MYSQPKRERERGARGPVQIVVLVFRGQRRKAAGAVPRHARPVASTDRPQRPAPIVSTTPVPERTAAAFPSCPFITPFLPPSSSFAQPPLKFYSSVEPHGGSAVTHEIPSDTRFRSGPRRQWHMARTNTRATRAGVRLYAVRGDLSLEWYVQYTHCLCPLGGSRHL
jgi:hypothetical protein